MIAVVDASNEDELDAAGQPSPCRYLSSIANLPLIVHVLDGLAQLGIERVVVVASEDVRRRLTAVVHTGKAWRLEVSFVDKRTESSSSTVIAHLRREIEDSPALVHAGDCLFPRSVAQMRERFTTGDLDLLLLVRPEAQHGDHEARSPQRIRLPREQPQGTAMMVGASVWPVLEEVAVGAPSLRRLAEALRAAGRRVGTLEAGEHWCYRDSGESLLIANRMLLDALPFDAEPACVGKDSEPQGRIAISPSASVSGSTLRGPVVVGANAIIEDSFIGPYTAIGAGATVIGAELDNAMVLAGAQVRYPGQRLEGSVIGERAVVSQSFSLPSGLHLRVGPDARVVLG